MKTFSMAFLTLVIGVASAPGRPAAPVPLTPAQKALQKQVKQLLDEADRLDDKGTPAAAEPLVRKALAIERSLYGEPSRRGLKALQWLAGELYGKGDLRNAEAASQEVEDVLARWHGKTHWQVKAARWSREYSRDEARRTPEQRKILAEASRCHDEAMKLYEKGQADKAISLSQRSLKLRTEVLGADHLACAHSLNGLALIFEETGEHEQAAVRYRRAAHLYQEAFGFGHPAHATCLHNLGTMYRRTGRYQLAIPLYEQVVAIRKENFGEHTSDHIDTLSRLAEMYVRIGDYLQATPMARQVLKLTGETSGEKSKKYALAQSLMAYLYDDMGDYRQALALYGQSSRLTRELEGESVNYAVSLTSMGVLHMRMGEYLQALPLLEDGWKRLEKTKAAQRVNALVHLVEVYGWLDRYRESLPLARQAVKLSREVLGEKHRDHSSSLQHLAAIHQALGEHDQALVLQQRALRIQQEVLGQTHPRTFITLNRLAGLYHELGDRHRALYLIDQTLRRTRDHYERIAILQSERQQMAALAAFPLRLALFLKITADRPSLASTAHTEVLAWKGAVLTRQRSARLARSSSSPEIRRQMAELQAITRELALLALAPNNQRTEERRTRRLEELTRDKEDLETRLSQSNPAFGAERKRATLTSRQLQEMLPGDIALVDFLVHRVYSTRGKEPSSRLVAFVVRRNADVVRLDLGPTGPIEVAIASWRVQMGRPRRGEEDAGQTLRTLLWLPIEKHLGSAQTVLISPDGMLSRLPFGALPGSKPNRYLIEERALAVVPVPQLLPELLDTTNKVKSHPPTLLLVGDVDFDSAPTATAAGDSRSAPRGAAAAWAKLPGTGREIVSIGKTFAARFAKGHSELRQDRASKPVVRQALGRHRFVHLATHGFFAPAEVKSALSEGLFGNEGIKGWHPLLLSGLVLAGANREPRPGEEDGILTALEVSDLDLSGCELAVLSACETGLGRVAGGEGVLGLQRAFQVAGARATVTSLWQVPDEATAALMERFYAHLWEGKKSKLDALLSAQRWLLRHGPKHPGLTRAMVRKERKDDVEKLDHLPPYYWAAFVLAGDWR